MEDRDKIYRAIWVAQILIGLMTILNGILFYFVKLTSRSATPKQLYFTIIIVYL